VGQEADPHRRREVRRIGTGAVLAVALLLLVPAPAAADDPPRTDPEIGSPSEEVYGIPLEEARRDAAPRIVPEAAIRTELGVGSSARVPGRGQDPRADPPGDPDRRAERVRKRRRQAAQAATRLSGDSSAAATTLLLVLVVGIASTGGVAAGRLIGRRARL
jgi:hypothetical protein